MKTTTQDGIQASVKAECEKRHIRFVNRSSGQYSTDTVSLDSLVEVVESLIQSQRDEIGRLTAGLKWYAEGNHYVLDDDWDTVSGEPQEWLCGPESGMIEDGGVARTILAGGHMVEGDDDLIAEPLMTPEQHKTALARVEALITVNPEADSLDGMELQQLAGAVERYEKRVYGALSPTTNEGAEE
jgi:hypothetical protein